MKFIKQALIGIIGLSVVVTLFSLLLPSETHGRRGIVINAAPEKILPQLNNFSNWKNWHPNFNPDSSSITYLPPSLTGLKNNCNLTRNGKVDYYQFTVINDSTIAVLLHRKGENIIQNLFTLSKDASTNGTYVDWKFISQLKWYPWEKFSGFFTESFTAPGMMLALENLKSYVETTSRN